jgi:5-methylthioribose kinase
MATQDDVRMIDPEFADFGPMGFRQTIDVWNRFAARFVELWNTEAKGDAYTAELFAGADSRAALADEQTRYMKRLFEDTVGFAGCKMIRRILGPRPCR